VNRAATVESAAETLVAAFADGRVADYFDCFAPDATFVFHSTPERLDSRDAYRALWRRWEVDDGFGILGCTSSNVRVQMAGERVAVFVHDVVTRVATRSGEEELRERETIVFERSEERWLAIHEHLSPMP
jgi:ketosteroid isomerase-like protein